MRLLPAVKPDVRRAWLVDLSGGIPFGIFAGMVLPFLGVTARRLGSTPLQVSLVVAAPAIGMLFSAWWGALAARANPVPVVVWPGAVARALFLLAPLARTPEAFLALVIAFQLIHNGQGPAYVATIRAVFPPHVRGTLLSLVRVGISLAMILASLAAGPLLERFGYAVVFPIAALFGVAGALLFGRMRAAAPQPEARPALRDAWRVAVADRRFRLVLAATFVFGFGGWMMAPAVPILLVDVFRADNATVGVLAAVGSGAAVAGYYLWGRFVDRRSGRATMQLVIALSTLTPLLYLVAPAAWFAALPFASDGFLGAAVELGWMATVMEMAPAHQVGQYAGTYASLVGLRGIIAPVLAGALIHVAGPRPVFAISAALTAVAAILARAWIRSAPPKLPLDNARATE